MGAIEIADDNSHAQFVGASNKRVHTFGVSGVKLGPVLAKGVVVDAVIRSREARAATLKSGGKGAQPITVPFGQRVNQSLGMRTRVPVGVSPPGKTVGIGLVIEDALDETRVHQQAVRFGFARTDLRIDQRAVDLERFVFD